MTNEEIEIIKIVFQSYLNIVKLYNKPNSEEVITKVRDKLIKELEQQPCGNCISREAVIEDVIKCTDMNEDTMEVLEDKVRALQSVTPQPKRGKWIGEESLDGSIRYMCDNCKEFECVDYYDFCPNCGADMRESEDEG